MNDVINSDLSSAPGKSQLHRLELLPFFGVLIFVILSYSPIIVNAFNGDDFVHLKWLAEAVNNPELIWRNFYNAWLDITTAKFYRPLISIFMLFDYVVWKTNGIGFHLTNVLCHVLNTCLFWLFLKKLPFNAQNTKWNYIWCLSAATLFGLYPLHPEAVSWITGRVDTFVTLFSLASIYGFICWSESFVGNKFVVNRWFFLCMTTMFLGLLCKEMAIMLPAIFCVYEFILGRSDLKFKQKIISILKKTFVFWLILILYFVLRYFALGTLLGGYDNSVLDLNSLHGVISNWRHSLYVLFFPFNTNLISKNNPFTFIWGALLIGNVFFIAKDVFVEKKNVSTFWFLITWLILTLIPVYKLFNIGVDLQGSRLAYFPSVPLCALLCFGYANCLQIKEQVQYWKIAVLALLLSAAGAALLVNNSAWIQADNISKAILGQFDDLSKTLGSNSIVYVVGLPDQSNGAYVCRNALDGMTKFPQISKSILHCFNLDEINHVFPFGFAKYLMKMQDERSQLYVWNNAQQKLQKVVLSSQVAKLPLIIDIAKEISTENSEIIIEVKDKSCFDFDCLIVKTELERATGHKNESKVANLFYSNEIFPQFDKAHRLDAWLDDESGEQCLVFPLHGQADWALGGKADKLKLVLPKSRAAVIKSISFESLSETMPQLSFDIKENQNSLGFIELTSKNPTCQLEYDSSKVVGAKNLVLEISAPDQIFTALNDARDLDTTASNKELQGLAGLISLKREDFRYPGIYELRLKSLDGNKKQTGMAGDHIVVTVK